MIWLIGLAAFLLFHGDRARAWKGVERRVHTRILEDLPLGVCLTTESGTIVYANHAEDATFGYETGELIGKNVTRLHPSDGAEPVLREVIDRLGPSQIWSGELARRRKDTTTPNVTSWITNLDVAGKFYRVFIHDPYSWQDSQSKPPTLDRRRTGDSRSWERAGSLGFQLSFFGHQRGGQSAGLSGTKRHRRWGGSME